jgi:hypothetical protein
MANAVKSVLYINNFLMLVSVLFQKTILAKSPMKNLLTPSLLNGAHNPHRGGYALPQVEEGLSLFPYPGPLC